MTISPERASALGAKILRSARVTGTLPGGGVVTDSGPGRFRHLPIGDTIDGYARDLHPVARGRANRLDASAAEADTALLEAIMLEGMREALGADAPVRVDVRVCSLWAGSGE